MSDLRPLIQRDLNHVWHPCSQMKDFETYPPLVVHQAQGCYLQTDHGQLIDAISSWWCKSLGHGHPAVMEAIRDQLNRFEHVIGANTTHPTLVELAEKLTEITGKQHVFFASDGSCAIEIALKLALHAQQLKGQAQRHHFIALEQGYHGETCGALGVSDLGQYKTPYSQLTPTCTILHGLPYVDGISDPLWSNCDPVWPQLLKQLDAVKDTACAIILEPIIQGAGGMRIYSADFLNRLAQYAKTNGIFLIADEIMTGLCRTGKWLASDYAAIDPDLVCLSKGLTSGTLPLSCTMIHHRIYDLFYDDYDQGKSFLHSHTYSGHALAVSAALATLRVMESEGIMEQANVIGEKMRGAFSEIADQTGQLEHVRQIGAIVAADLKPHPTEKRLSQRIYHEALKQGALIRPIGNTLYWLPPLNISDAIIGQLSEITLNSIERTYNTA